MYCDAKDCFKPAKYLRIFDLPDGRSIRFNLCEECNKLNWKVEEGKHGTTETHDQMSKGKT